MNNPIKELTKKEWIIWLGSICIVCVSNLLTTDFDLPTLVAALVGVTSLIFAAKGNVWAQILMVIFSILYGIISYRFHYWGEMITYLGMTMPMAIWSMITWLRNPSGGNGNVVKIQKLNRKHIIGLIISAEIKEHLYDIGASTKAVSYIYGLGGRDYTTVEATDVFNQLEEMIEQGKTIPQYQYIGLRK